MTTPESQLIHLPQVEGVRIELRGQGLTIVGGCCNLPFATVPHVNLLVQSKHNGFNHMTVLSARQLRGLADVVEYLERLRG